MTTDYNPYVIIDEVTMAKVMDLLNTGRTMAEKSYPHLVENYERVIKQVRERAEEEKLRRHLHGDKGAKFSKGKRMCILGDVCGCVTTFATKDNLVAEFYEPEEDVQD